MHMLWTSKQRPACGKFLQRNYVEVGLRMKLLLLLPSFFCIFVIKGNCASISWREEERERERPAERTCKRTELSGESCFCDRRRR